MPRAWAVAESVRTRWWPRRRHLAIVTLGLLALIVLLAPHYGDAQTAADADAFRSAFASDERLRYAAAAVVDVLFAVSYGLLAFVWSGYVPAQRRILAGVATAGGFVVAAAALFDVAENVVVLANVLRYSSVDDGDVDLMRSIGDVKWTLGYLGAGLVLGAIAANRLWGPGIRDQVKTWVRSSRAPYAVYLLLLASAVPLAVLGLRSALVWVLLPLLALCGSWLNGKVKASREALPGAPDLGPARLALAFCQLAAGVLLVSFGGQGRGSVRDIAYFLGLGLVILSLGALVSELRQNRRLADLRGPLLVAVGLASLGLATTVAPGWTFLGLLAAGFLLGEVGTELGSEDYQRWSPTPAVTPWLVGGTGVVVACVGLALLVTAGVDPGHVLPVAALLAVVVLAASADGDALVLVLVVAIALAWSTTPTDATLDDERRPEPGEPYFVVLGDSYISGEGASTFLEGTNEIVRDRPDGDRHLNECRQAPTAWPFVLAARVADESSNGEGRPLAGFPTRVMFLACSGAVTENIDTQPRLNRRGRQLGPAELALYESELEALEEAAGRDQPPAFVVVSIGGNDAGFGDIGQTCVGPGNCAEVAEQFLRSRPTADPPPPGGQAEPVEEIGDDLRAAYERIRDVVGDVPVVVTAYPNPVDAAGRCRGVLLGSDERAFIRAYVTQLNRHVRQVARDNGFYYMDIDNALTARNAQLCNSVNGSSGLNFFALNTKGGAVRDSLSPTNWLHNSLHPNAAGHEALAAAAHDWLVANWPLETDAPWATDPDPPDPVDAVLEELAVTQCDPTTRRSCAIDGRVWTLEQAHDLFAQALFPLTVLVLGLWLVMAPLVKAGRDSGWTLLGIARRVPASLAAAGRWLWGSSST